MKLLLLLLFYYYYLYEELEYLWVKINEDDKEENMKYRINKRLAIPAMLITH